MLNIFRRYIQPRKLLISFCNLSQLSKSGLLLYDLDTSSGIQLDLGYPEEKVTGNTGLCVDDKRVYSLFNSSTVSGSASYIVILEKDGFSPLVCQELDAIIDPHSICVVQDRIFIASTGTDEIVEYKLGTSGLSAPHVIWRASDTKMDTHHVNSVAWVNGHLWCTCFGPKKGERWSTASDGYIFDITANQMVKQGIFHPHSLCEYRRNVYYCESVRSAFCRLEGCEQPFDGYTRGITFMAENRAIVATSVGRKVSRSQNLLYGVGNFTGGFVEGRCAIHWYDMRRSGKTTYDMSEFGTEIYDLCYVQ